MYRVIIYGMVLAAQTREELIKLIAECSADHAIA